MLQTTSLFDFKGKTAVITGASRGLGRACAEVLAAAGARIVIAGREIATLQKVAEELSVYGAEILPVQCDMSEPKQIRSLSSEAETFGNVDILVNNAGIIRRAPAVEYTPDDWEAVIAVNLTGAFLLTQEIGKKMVERRTGKIINIASLLSFTGGLNVVAYTASKAAIAGMTKALANEWASSGVNVNAIAPGYFHTDATEALQRNSERYETLRARIPARRWGEPEDIQGPLLFLSSSASDYVNGHILAVDGGFLIS